MPRVDSMYLNVFVHQMMINVAEEKWSEPQFSWIFDYIAIVSRYNDGSFTQR